MSPEAGKLNRRLDKLDGNPVNDVMGAERSGEEAFKANPRFDHVPVFSDYAG
jgi:hypothetical protein